MKDSPMKAAFESGPDCPSLETLVRGTEFPCGSPERQVVEDHLKACAACRAELALFREFENAQARPEETEAVEWIGARLASSPASLATGGRKVIEMPPRWWQTMWASPMRLGALGAAAVLIFAVALSVPWHRSEPVRDGSADVLRSAPLRALAPAGELNAPPKEFRWNAVDGAVGYVVKVSEVDRTVVFQRKISATSLPVPVEVGKLIQPGKTLLWSVTAEDVSGRKLTESGEQRFRLEAPPH